MVLYHSNFFQDKFLQTFLLLEVSTQDECNPCQDFHDMFFTVDEEYYPVGLLDLYIKNNLFTDLTYNNFITNHHINSLFRLFIQYHLTYCPSISIKQELYNKYLNFCNINSSINYYGDTTALYSNEFERPSELISPVITK